MGGGVKAAAIRSAGIVHRLAPQKLRELFKRAVVARVDESVFARRPRDMTAIKCGNGQSGQRIDDLLAKTLGADVLKQHPQKMGDTSRAPILKAFISKTQVDLASKIIVFRECCVG